MDPKSWSQSLVWFRLIVLWSMWINISLSLLPPSSDDVVRGLRTSCRLMCQSNHIAMETGSLEYLENRWPHIYSCVKDDYVNNCIPYVDDRSEELVAIVLLSIMRSFGIAFSEESEPNFSAEKLAMYLRIGEIFLSLRLKYYGPNFPDEQEAYFFLTTMQLLPRNWWKGWISSLSGTGISCC